MTRNQDSLNERFLYETIKQRRSKYSILRIKNVNRKKSLQGWASPKITVYPIEKRFFSLNCL